MDAGTNESFFLRLGASLRAKPGEAPPDGAARARPHILVATDFSATAAVAVESATRLSARLGARLEIVHVLSVAPVVYGDFVWAPTQQQIERMTVEAQASLDAAVAGARKVAPEIEIGGTLRDGLVPDALLAVIEVERPDLVVTGTHGRGFWSRLVMGSVARAVARRSVVPVLTLHDDGVDTKAMSILAPVELGAISEDALDLAAGLAKCLGMRLRLLHVFPGADAFELAGDAGHDPAIAKASQAALEALAGPERRSRLEVESVTRFGSAAREIALEAERSRAALVVMGTHRRGIVKRAIEGSVAEDVLRLCPRPVVTCREDVEP